MTAVRRGPPDAHAVGHSGRGGDGARLDRVGLLIR